MDKAAILKALREKKAKREAARAKAVASEKDAAAAEADAGIPCLDAPPPAGEKKAPPEVDAELPKGTPAETPPEKGAPANTPTADSKHIFSGVVGKKYELKSGKIRVTRQFKCDGTITEDDDEDDIPVGVFETLPAMVRLSLANTINMGDYNSVKVNVDVTVPCYVEELPEAYKFCKKFVCDRLVEELVELEADKCE